MINNDPAEEFHRCCPWWLAYGFDNGLRRLFQKPELIVGPHLKEGSIALDLGAGMGYFSIAMARMAGPSGRVISVDVQQRILEVLMSRAKKQGVADRIEPRLASREGPGVPDKVDFALAMWMVHEVPDQDNFFREVAACLKPDARFLIAEPRMHVTGPQFKRTLAAAARAGLRAVSRPRVGLSRAALLTIQEE